MGRKRKPNRTQEHIWTLARREFIWWVKNILLALIAMFTYDGLKLWWKAPKGIAPLISERLVVAGDALSVGVVDLALVSERLVVARDTLSVGV